MHPCAFVCRVCIIFSFPSAPATRCCHQLGLRVKFCNTCCIELKFLFSLVRGTWKFSRFSSF
uniref:Secreted protein n=1 Tax=Aegilops tauschii subsp. strangulata TaxID=200361 RepID=A0A453HLK0_AEGTS